MHIGITNPTIINKNIGNKTSQDPISRIKTYITYELNNKAHNGRQVIIINTFIKAVEHISNNSIYGFNNEEKSCDVVDELECNTLQRNEGFVHDVQNCNKEELIEWLQNQKNSIIVINDTVFYPNEDCGKTLDLTTNYLELFNVMPQNITFFIKELGEDEVKRKIKTELLPIPCSMEELDNIVVKKFGIELNAVIPLMNQDAFNNLVRDLKSDRFEEQITKYIKSDIKCCFKKYEYFRNFDEPKLISVVNTLKQVNKTMANMDEDQIISNMASFMAKICSILKRNFFFERARLSFSQVELLSDVTFELYKMLEDSQGLINRNTDFVIDGYLTDLDPTPPTNSVFCVDNQRIKIAHGIIRKYMNWNKRISDEQEIQFREILQNDFAMRNADCSDDIWWEYVIATMCYRSLENILKLLQDESIPDNIKIQLELARDYCIAHDLDLNDPSSVVVINYNTLILISKLGYLNPEIKEINLENIIVIERNERKEFETRIITFVDAVRYKSTMPKALFKLLEPIFTVDTFIAPHLLVYFKELFQRIGIDMQELESKFEIVIFEMLKFQNGSATLSYKERFMEQTRDSELSGANGIFLQIRSHLIRQCNVTFIIELFPILSKDNLLLIPDELLNVVNQIDPCLIPSISILGNKIVEEISNLQIFCTIERSMILYIIAAVLINLSSTDGLGFYMKSADRNSIDSTTIVRFRLIGAITLAMSVKDGKYTEVERNAIINIIMNSILTPTCGRELRHQLYGMYAGKSCDSLNAQYLKAKKILNTKMINNVPSIS